MSNNESFVLYKSTSYLRIGCCIILRSLERWRERLCGAVGVALTSLTGRRRARRAELCILFRMSSPIPLSSLPRASQPLRSHSHSPSAPDSIEDIFPEHEPERERNHTQPVSPRTVIHPPWKRDLLALLERPTSSSAAFVIHFTTTSLIVISALVTVLETVPAFHYISPATWFGLETSLVALFTVEYVARSVAWSYSWSSLARWVGCAFLLASQ